MIIIITVVGVVGVGRPNVVCACVRASDSSAGPRLSISSGVRRRHILSPPPRQNVVAEVRFIIIIGRPCRTRLHQPHVDDDDDDDGDDGDDDDDDDDGLFCVCRRPQFREIRNPSRRRGDEPVMRILYTFYDQNPAPTAVYILYGYYYYTPENGLTLFFRGNLKKKK